jgi:hypothetical protein
MVLDQCTVTECENGEVFCVAGSPDFGEVLNQVPEPKTKCRTNVLDAACSDLIECGRRVPAISTVGLSTLTLAMIAGGIALLRLRRRHA